jgi:hypothetical protein
MSGRPAAPHSPFASTSNSIIMSDAQSPDDPEQSNTGNTFGIKPFTFGTISHRRKHWRGDLSWVGKDQWILIFAIPRFESWHPSQPLSSLWAVSASRIISRHFRRLARDQSVSARAKSPFSGSFRNSCARVSGREFLTPGFCCLRLGSTALRPVDLREVRP